jgi:hypothetical protein
MITAETVSRILRLDGDADMALGLRSSRGLLSTMDPAAASRAREHVHPLLAAHETEERALLDSRAWIITAHRP